MPTPVRSRLLGTVEIGERYEVVDDTLAPLEGEFVNGDIVTVHDITQSESIMSTSMYDFTIKREKDGRIRHFDEMELNIAIKENRIISYEPEEEETEEP